MNEKYKIMKFIYLIISFSVIYLLDVYLKLNISSIGEQGASVEILILFVLLSLLLITWRLKTAGAMIIQSSIWVALVFFYYLALMVMVNANSIDKLKAITFATSGGIIFYYTIGLLVAIILGRHPVGVLRNEKYLKHYKFCMFTYMIFSLISLLWVFYGLSSRVRGDILLLADADGSYQRPGNLLVISYLLMVALYSQFSAMKKLNEMFNKNIIFDYLIALIFIVYTLASLLISQLIGSNSATVVIAGLGVIAVTISIIISSKKVVKYLSGRKINFADLICGKIFYWVLLNVALGFIALIFVVIFIANYVDIDLSMTRLGGFGTGDISSVSSRLKLWDNFVIQLDNSPILGNTEVDCFTTGCGSYVHSLPASLLTHTGMVGTSFFFVFLFFFFKERFSVKLNLINNGLLFKNINNLYSAALILFVLIISSLATFFTWPILWFSFGLFSMGVLFRNN